ncbi:MAG: hypothetical protein K1W33_05305 [Clostridia bacterium]
MDKKQTMIEVNRIFKTIFGKECPYNLEELLNKFAFDVKLPQKVHDSVTGEITWTQSINASKFIKQVNMEDYDTKHGWLQPKREVSNLNDILKLWKRINYTTTERIYDCINVSESDPLYRCENVYRSTDLRNCKNAIYCDGLGDSENIIASQRTSTSSFCIRVDDSANCTNSYNVICSNKISNSFFIQDANNLNECMFCSHMSNRRYCIANMQFEKDEYFEIKAEIIKWILST